MSKEAEIIPGTEYMRYDNEIHHAIKTGSGRQRDIVLIPQPSDDLHDPLNWSRKWKFAAVANQAFFCLVSLWLPLSIAPLTPILMEEFHKTPSQIALLTGLVVLSLGYANLWIVPFSDIYGRRPATLLCSIITLASDIWQALSKSYPSFLGARFINGIGSAANETLMVAVITDVFFLHERGTWMGVYFYTYTMGNFLGPVISGNIAAHVSWRWFFWVCTIVQGLSVVLLALFFPETKYQRQKGLQHAEAPIDCDTASDSIGDKQEVSQEIEQARISPPFQGSIDDQENGIQDSRAEIKHDGYPSTKQRYAFITQPDPRVLSRLFEDFFTPIKLFTFPIIIWAAFSMCFYVNCILALNLTQSEVFAHKPYSFAPSSVGFVTLALLGGSIIGLVTAGPLSDYISAWSTKRNGGIREPEMRLPAMIPFMLANVVGMTIIAVGYQDHWSWQVLVIVGWGLVGFSCATVPALSVTYAVDCYKPVAGQIMVTCTIVKNTFGFGMTYYMNKWAESSGYLPGIMMMMSLCLGTSLLGLVVLYNWGKQLRTWTAQSSVHSF